MLSSPIHLDANSQHLLFGTQAASTAAPSLRKMSHGAGPNSRPPLSTTSSNSFILDDEDRHHQHHTQTSSRDGLEARPMNKFDIPYVPDQIFIGGRKSQLAVAQSNIVKGLVKENFPSITCPILALTTLGDQVQNKPLYSFGGKSLWTKELEILLLEGIGDFHKLDLIVHSLKDMPTNLPDEFELGCVVKREDPSDAVCMSKGSQYTKLDELPKGSVVGTSSVRRSAQLKRHYPHLVFESVRGNLQTRLRKLDDPETPFKCIILATAGLVRMGLEHRITQRLDSNIMYHAVGQGALGIEIRKGDALMKSILETIEDKNATVCCLAERAVMRTLEGGCSVPIGVSSFFNEETKLLRLKAVVISVDGTQYVENEITRPIEDYRADSEAVGVELANMLKAQGAKAILDEIDFQKINEKDE
ncbi:hydroxymethylbilane synthase [Cyberlindnera jadinii NRRL Y-1542]|uniref:Porphobilinogen deaminase n=1 Tax=Cyberlindnera jadinii (strain ATCC 18201 / CBS 1600 / BCRC 20928 / JCM 3617 / NBRC 0987 / NRRL Y-1542) TaxID=983966 RepID=A0A1E4S2J8_CYBJN|nr:porphobilinogen deaminase [Cyberlindnera jadinii NRRL Y-1542]ODV73660.1 porphobilinogen deaminase [Cyberlindnera jadinii NRRL Y-1542]